MSEFIFENYSIEDLLSNDEAENEFCSKFKKHISSRRQYVAKRLKEIDQKTADNNLKCTNLNCELQNGIEKLNQLKSEKKRCNNELSQFILDKDQLKEKSEQMKKEISELTLKLDDIKREINNQNEKLKCDWSAIVAACNIYKKYLDLHLQMDVIESIVQIQVTFFFRENLDKDNYFIKLLHKSNNWTVEKIVPDLKSADQKEINNLPNSLDNIQVTVLLCKLRKIFMSYKND